MPHPTAQQLWKLHWRSLTDQKLQPQLSQQLLQLLLLSLCCFQLLLSPFGVQGKLVE
jgi:hypothetical protein